MDERATAPLAAYHEQKTKELTRGVDFVLLDIWKELYVSCLDAFFPKLVPGAVVVADNMIVPGTEAVFRYAKAVRARPRLTSILVPVRAGLEISRFDENSFIGARPA